MNNCYSDTAMAIMSAVYIQREMKALIECEVKDMKKAVYNAWYSLPPKTFSDDPYMSIELANNNIDAHAYWNWYLALCLELKDKVLEINKMLNLKLTMPEAR